MSVASMVLLTVLRVIVTATAEPVRLESPALRVEIDSRTGAWFLTDKPSGVRWPSEGTASIGAAAGLDGDFDEVTVAGTIVRLAKKTGAAVVFELTDADRGLEIRFEGGDLGDIRVLDDALVVTDREAGSVVVPCREGLLIPTDSGIAFKQTFGTSEYEGCHMNMLGVLKKGAALAVSWDDAYVWVDIESTLPQAQAYRQKIATALTLKRSARSVRLRPLGKGDWNVLAAGYRRIAESKGLGVTLRDRIRRDPHTELLVGAANFKLWICLERRMSNQSTKEESVTAVRPKMIDDRFVLNACRHRGIGHGHWTQALELAKRCSTPVGIGESVTTRPGCIDRPAEVLNACRHRGIGHHTPTDAECAAFVCSTPVGIGESVTSRRRCRRRREHAVNQPV